MSQPKTRLPMSGRSSCGIAPRCSIVRYEMQRVASMTGARMDEHGVAPEPAETRALRQLAFEDRTRVDVRPGGRQFVTGNRLDLAQQQQQLLLHDTMIVAAAGIACDDRA
jgi:hypothetical protein